MSVGAQILSVLDFVRLSCEKVARDRKAGVLQLWKDKSVYNTIWKPAEAPEKPLKGFFIPQMNVVVEGDGPPPEELIAETPPAADVPATEFMDEKDIVACLNGTASYKPDTALSIVIEGILILCAGDHDVARFRADVALENLRIDAANYFLARAKRLHPTRVLIAGDWGVETFDREGQTHLLSTAHTFSESLKKYELLAQNGGDWHQKCAVEARNLFTAKTGDVVSANLTALERIADTLVTFLVDYNPIMVATTNVNKIKTELINNPHHEKVFPMLFQLLGCEEFCQSLVRATATSLGTDFPRSKQKAKKAIDDGKLYLGAVALATAIYVTLPNDRLSINWKEKSVRQTKREVAELGIRLPISLFHMLDANLKIVLATANADAATAKAKAKAKPKAKR